ncbi:MAG TPA: class I SAM-dependent methyltransferase [Gaiellaceae bacterium]|nr:class I SAM-dependent methyltransferase [Gaiellaceae bacterium]
MTLPAPAPRAANGVEALLVEGVERFGGELGGLREWARLRNEQRLFPAKGMYDWLESQVLYLLLRLTRPSLVVEISPSSGYSSGFILLALNRNAHGRLLSFDVDTDGDRRARLAFAEAGIDPSRRRFVAGDARSTAAAALPAGESVDVLFMDAEHSSSFASWYLETLVPRVRPGGLVQVHDVLRYGVKPQVVDEGEGEAVWEYLVRNGTPESDFLYVAELVRTQPVRPVLLRRLTRYPFDDPRLGTDGVEQSPSLWIIRR